MKKLVIENIFKYFGGLLATNAVSFNVNPGEIVGLIGPNGAGKTTIFNCITGFLNINSGKIYFGEDEIQNKEPYIINKKGIARTFQIPQTFRKMTVLENVMVGSFCRTNSKNEAINKAKSVLNFTNLYDKKDYYGNQLTLADEKILSIARALATEPELLLLDEAMSGLTPLESNQAIEMVNKIRDIGISLIIVEHVMEIVMPISDKVVVINAGNKIAEGKPSIISKEQSVIECYLGGE